MGEVVAAQCALHPASLSVGICARCGRFMCVECAKPSGFCTACEPLALDPYGLARAFDVVAAMLAAGRMFRASFSSLLAIALFDTGIELAGRKALGNLTGVLEQFPLVTLFAMGMVMQLFRVVPSQASFAILAARGEGRTLGLGHALWESLLVWPRAVSAAIRAQLWTALGLFLFFIPGVWLAVRQLYAQVAAFRTREDDPLEVSHDVLSGRFLQGVVAAVAGYGTLAVVFTVASAVDLVVRGHQTPLAWGLQLSARFISSVMSMGFINAFFYASFMMTAHGAGYALKPVPWRDEPPLDQRSQS